MQNNLLSLIIFAPLAGAAINWLVGRRLRNEQFIGIVACASVGLSTYLLIGFYLDKDEAAPAAKKAFIANRVGDWGFILGVMLIFFLTSAAGHGSISFFNKPAQDVTSALAVIGNMQPDVFNWHA